MYTLLIPFSCQKHHCSTHSRNTRSVADCLTFHLFVCFLMITYVVDIVGFLFPILLSGKDTSNICLTMSTWAKACRVRQKLLQEFDRNNLSSLIHHRCRRKHSYIFQAFHMGEVALTKGHKETNSLYFRNVKCQ